MPDLYSTPPRFLLRPRRWLNDVRESISGRLVPAAEEHRVLYSDGASSESDEEPRGTRPETLSMEMEDGDEEAQDLALLEILFRLSWVIGIGWTLGLCFTYPSPSTVPIFVGAAIILTSWVLLAWIELGASLLRRRSSSRKILSSHTERYWLILALCSPLVCWWFTISLISTESHRRSWIDRSGDKYFIAVNLHNNEAIMSAFVIELTALIYKLGKHNVFVSIYESNSRDGTVAHLQAFDKTLADAHIRRRIITNFHDPGADWPYGTSPERIEFLARARNRVMEPLQSEHDGIRLDDWESFTKVIFLNDILFKWQDMMELIETRLDDSDGYDLACAMDFGSAGLYDTWVARDLCGTPLRPFWPFVKDRASQMMVRREAPFPVSSCWNGAVVFDAAPVRYHPTAKGVISKKPRRRGWKMVDDRSRKSPNLTDPIRFRTSGIDACDHSECFLFSYDLHRYYNNTVGRPRIIMNPRVKVAYEHNWYHWNNVFLRRPVIRWWLRIWSHGLGYRLFDWPFEHLGRRRDYCTWAALKIPRENGRCSALPGAKERPWNQ